MHDIVWFLFCKRKFSCYKAYDRMLFVCSIVNRRLKSVYFINIKGNKLTLFGRLYTVIMCSKENVLIWIVYPFPLQSELDIENESSHQRNFLSESC